MRFVDEVKIKVTAGNGGSGFVGWRREKFVPHGGPDGGDGGNGGAIVFKANSGLNTLIDYSFNPLVNAEHGSAGGTKQLHGKDGETKFCAIPIGTQVFFEGRLVADLNQNGATWIAARGGRGGKGNAFFKSAQRQAPDFAQPGQPGENFEFTLVLKSVADVGLVGLPNVGKSTLISKVSSAKPKIGDYPFTTIRPSLGVVYAGSAEKSFVIADIPGLVPGAHAGKGLGIDFLKHIERTHVLCQLVDATQGLELSEDPLEEEIAQNALSQIDAIETELRLFSEELIARPRVIIFSKADLPYPQLAYQLLKDSLIQRVAGVHLVSSESGLGLESLIQQLASLSLEARKLLV